MPLAQQGWYKYPACHTGHVSPVGVRVLEVCSFVRCVGVHVLEMCPDCRRAPEVSLPLRCALIVGVFPRGVLGLFTLHVLTQVSRIDS